MAELRAFRMTGGPAGIHLYGAAVWCDRDGRIKIGLTRKPFGVARPAFVPAVERDDAPNRFQIVYHLLDQRIEIGADEQNLGAGIVDHISDLGRR